MEFICNKDNHNDMTHYRIDRITDIRLTDLPVKPYRRLDGFHDGWNLQEYMEQNINMAFGEPVLITFIAIENAIPGIIDTFGKGVSYSCRSDGFMTAASVFRYMTWNSGQCKTGTEFSLQALRNWFSKWKRISGKGCRITRKIRFDDVGLICQQGILVPFERFVLGTSTLSFVAYPLYKIEGR